MIRPTRNRTLSAALACASFVFANLVSLPAWTEDSIVVRDFVLSHGIQDREPVSNTDSFHIVDGKAFAFARIQNTDSPTTVSFVWEFGDTTYAVIPVNVGVSPAWRTWSTIKLRPGNWRVNLLDADGEVLLEKPFQVATNSSGLPAPPSHGGHMGRREFSADFNDIPASFDFLRRQ